MRYNCAMLRTPAIVLFAWALMGCSDSRRLGPGAGPITAAPIKLERSNFTADARPVDAWRVVTPHYTLETTIADKELVEALGQLMEGALSQYRELAPAVAMSDKPMQCFVFASRTEWAQFTKANTGSDAEIYLKINRGGYAVRDWYVAYYIGDIGTYSVAAHEGWHQYVARHFRRRPPPFLEEGLATLFELVWWEGGLPRWRLGVNPTRLGGLERTVERNALIPLEELCAMHAGQVVSKTSARVEAFYSQCWAFARFMWEAQGGKYRGVLQQLLADAAVGRSWNTDDSRPLPLNLWNPSLSKPMLEHYFGKPVAEIDREYRSYINELINRSSAERRR